MGTLKIKGVIPPMITPFKENGDVDYRLHTNGERWNNANLAGIWSWAPIVKPCI